MARDARSAALYLEPPPYVPLGHTVDVDGRAIYIDCRGSGSPTVILEAGFGASAGELGLAPR